MKVFIDTGAFIALTDKDDANHVKSAIFYKEIKEKGVRFITSNFVVCETMNYLRAKVSHAAAILFKENLQKSRIIEVVLISSQIEGTAFEIFRQYEDKSFSYTDCTSFALMQYLRTRKAFAFDRHFEQYDHFARLP